MFVALKTKADIYHIHDPELLPVGFFMRWILRRRVVYDVHEDVARQILGKEWLPRPCRSTVAFLYTCAEKVFSRGLAFILANEECLSDYPKKRTYLVRNFPLIDHSSDAPPQCRDRLPLTRSVQGEEAVSDKSGDSKRPDGEPALLHKCLKRTPPLLLFVGGVYRGRGAEIYLELARRLKDKGREFELIIIGPCHPKYKTLLEKKIERDALHDRVQLHGRLPHRQAMRLVSEASIGLCLSLPIPNHMTCLPTKILEYMMCGTAVLASNFAAWRPYVDGERSGLMADPTDIESVVSACERMLDDREELQAMAERGRRAVVERLNWEAEFQVLEQCYRDLMN